MKEFLANLDWMTLLSAVWTVILVPIGTQIAHVVEFCGGVI